MKISGAVFDLDGTILDSMYIWETVDEEYLKRKGLCATPEIRAALKTMSLAQAADFFRTECKIADSPEKIMADINGMVSDFYFYEVRPKEYVYEFLTFLKEKNIPMCIATASSRQLTEAALRRLGLLDFFEKILTCEEIGSGKDTPEIYIKSLDILCCESSETLVFEDAAHAAKTARNAGFKVCGVYDPSENDVDALKKFSDIYINSFKEAVNYID